MIRYVRKEQLVAHVVFSRRLLHPAIHPARRRDERDTFISNRRNPRNLGTLSVFYHLEKYATRTVVTDWVTQSTLAQRNGLKRSPPTEGVREFWGNYLFFTTSRGTQH